MCKPCRKTVVHELYKSEDVIDSLAVHANMIKSYRLIHNNKHYAVFQHKVHKNDIILWNLHLTYKDDKRKHKGHSHLKSVKIAKTICNKLAKNEKPAKSASEWILDSYLRCADVEYSHKKWIEELLYNKIDKKKGNNYYINSNKGIARAS